MTQGARDIQIVALRTAQEKRLGHVKMENATFILVRTKSITFPNKALLEIKGKAIIEHLIHPLM